MMVYLIRHGDAAGLAPGIAMSDAERPLTTEGIDRFRLAASSYARLIKRVDRVLTSPLLRARQTTELLVEAMDWKGESEVTEELHYSAPPLRAQAILQQELLAGVDSVACVGHEPHLGMLLGLLITGTDSAHIPLSKGMCVAVEIEAPQIMVGLLRFALSQKAARRLSRR